MFNVTRGINTPASLLEKKSWTGEDVIQALEEIFHGKCYICETKDPLSLNVEHFHAHEGDESKKYDWNNLFFACGRCNNLKRHFYNNLIDCTDPKVDALRSIRHGPPVTAYAQSIVIEPKNNDPKTIETANLIDRIFNEKDTGNKKVSGTYLRKRVFNKYYKLIVQIHTYFDEETPLRKKEDALEIIRTMMCKSQEYSAFLRWAVLDSPAIYELVSDCID